MENPIIINTTKLPTLKNNPHIQKNHHNTLKEEIKKLQ